MRKCTECAGIMQDFEAKTPEGINYSYYKCKSCGEEIVNTKQLHLVAEKYRQLKKYNTIIPEKRGIKIVPI